MNTSREARSSEKREGRDRLTVRDPLVGNALAGKNLDDINIGDVTKWGNRLAADARAWLSRGGFADRGRITQGDAHRMFVMAFSRKREAVR